MQRLTAAVFWLQLYRAQVSWILTECQATERFFTLSFLLTRTLSGVRSGRSRYRGDTEPVSHYSVFLTSSFDTNAENFAKAHNQI